MSAPLRVAVLGRTEMLLVAAKEISTNGHTIALVATSAGSDNYLAGPSDFEQLAQDHNAAFIRGTKLDSEPATSLLREIKCDVAISMNWPGLLPASVRENFRFGIFNAHPGDLPRYKGNACPNWAILNDEPHIGLCIHQMVDELDAGPVAARSKLPLTDSVDVEKVYGWLREEVPALFGALINQLSDGTLSLTPQPTDVNLSLRCFPRRPEDSRIDWNMPGASVMRLIRASTRPFSGATCFLDNTRIQIWRAQPYTWPTPYLAMPGQVLGRIEGDPIIETGENPIRILEATLFENQESAIPLILSSLRNRLT